MKRNLPPLNSELLKLIFDNVYSSSVTSELFSNDEKTDSFLKMVMVMKDFNYRYRQDDLSIVFNLTDSIFKYEPNSEGTGIWLGLILAIQELYNLNENQLIQTLKIYKAQA